MLYLHKHINTIFNSISYIVIDDTHKECVVIDVGDTNILKDIIKPFKLKAILLTHIHYDHIYGLNELINLYPTVPIFTNQFGSKSLKSPSDNLSSYHENKFVIKKNAKVQCIKNRNDLQLGNFSIITFESPGHDKSCICYIVGEWIFTGDSYIPEKKVFTKLQNGNKQDAENSLELIKDKSQDLVICPGHYI